MPIINIILPIVIGLAMAAVIVWIVYRKKKHGGGCSCGGSCGGCPASKQCHREADAPSSCCGPKK